MKAIIITTVLAIFLLVGGIFFVRFNFASQPATTNHDVTIKFNGIDYPFPLVYERGISLRNALAKIGIYNPHQIKHEVNRRQVPCDLDDLVTANGVYQVERWAT